MIDYRAQRVIQCLHASIGGTMFGETFAGESIHEMQQIVAELGGDPNLVPGMQLSAAVSYCVLLMMAQGRLP